MGQRAAKAWLCTSLYQRFQTMYRIQIWFSGRLSHTQKLLCSMRKYHADSPTNHINDHIIHLEGMTVTVYFNGFLHAAETDDIQRNSQGGRLRQGPSPGKGENSKRN